MTQAMAEIQGAFSGGHVQQRVAIVCNKVSVSNRDWRL